MWSLSGDALGALGINLDTMDPVEVIRGRAMCVPHGHRMRERFLSPQRLPGWLTEADLDVYVGEFERSGLSGPLSYYREMTASWNELEPMAGKPLTVPALHISGEFDVVRGWALESIARAPERIPNYLGTKVFAGCGHWTQQERPHEVNAAIIEFLRSLPN